MKVVDKYYSVIKGGTDIDVLHKAGLFDLNHLI